MTEQMATPEATAGSDGRETAGADLRSAREALGLSLRDVFAATRISLVNLQALEDEAFERLPPPVYTRNFIGKYAKVVGIDAAPLLARYERHLSIQPPSQVEEEVRRPWPENGRRWRFLVASLAAVIVAGSTVYALFLYDQGTPPPPSSAPALSAPAEAPAAPVSEPQATPAATVAPPTAPTPEPAADSPPVQNAGLYRLVLAARETTWVRITQDGRTPPFEALLKPGEEIERTAADHFLLHIGNAGGLHVTFQGKALGMLGKRGQIVHLRLPEHKAEARPAP